MPVSATTMSLPLQARNPRPTVETAGLSSRPATAADDDARRFANAVASGNEAAFREFYECYRQRLFRFVLVLARGNETLAHDTVQAAFLTAAQKLRAVENEDHLWNWLARVARQHLGKAWRVREQNSAIVSMAEPPDYPDAAATESVLEDNLDAAFRAMDADERVLLEWFYFDKLSHKEIAGKLAATPKSVSSRLERARAKLRATVNRKLSHET